MKYIYKYTNKINSKVYIGQTKSFPKSRAKKNGKGYIHCIKFYEDILKYGFDMFELEILEYVDDSIGDEREQYYIKLYDSINKGYNIDLGGKLHSKETKNKIANSGKGLNNSRAKNVCINNIPTNLSIRDYANLHNLNENTLRNWCRNNKNGFSYM